MKAGPKGVHPPPHPPLRPLTWQPPPTLRSNLEAQQHPRLVPPPTRISQAASVLEVGEGLLSGLCARYQQRRLYLGLINQTPRVSFRFVMPRSGCRLPRACVLLVAGRETWKQTNKNKMKRKTNEHRIRLKVDFHLARGCFASNTPYIVTLSHSTSCLRAASVALDKTKLSHWKSYFNYHILLRHTGYVRSITRSIKEIQLSEFHLWSVYCTLTCSEGPNYHIQTIINNIVLRGHYSNTLRRLSDLLLSTHDIPKPREATSVAMRMGALPLRNSATPDNRRSEAGVHF